MALGITADILQEISNGYLNVEVIQLKNKFITASCKLYAISKELQKITEEMRLDENTKRMMSGDEKDFIEELYSEMYTVLELFQTYGWVEE